MKDLRRYGLPPYSIAVIHGGPGARSDMTPVAQELSNTYSVLEPLQTAVSVNGQIKELNLLLKKYAKLPIILIGHSWGAWLSFIFAAKYPLLVKKLILVSSGPFEDKYVSHMMKIRLNRLSKIERIKLDALTKEMNLPDIENKDLILSRFGELMSKTDAFKPIASKHKVDIRSDIFEGVWQEAEKLRQSGELLRLAKCIKCPVIAIHGDYDPHPWLGVKNPLARYIKDFRFILLKKCGHTPWLEKYAKAKFYQALTRELT